MSKRIQTALVTSLSAVVICATIPSYAEAIRLRQYFEFGPPRELINRPVCWTLEEPSETYPCATVEP